MVKKDLYQNEVAGPLIVTTASTNLNFEYFDITATNIGYPVGKYFNCYAQFTYPITASNVFISASLITPNESYNLSKNGALQRGLISNNYDGYGTQFFALVRTLISSSGYVLFYASANYPSGVKTATSSTAFFVAPSPSTTVNNFMMSYTRGIPTSNSGKSFQIYGIGTVGASVGSLSDLYTNTTSNGMELVVDSYGGAGNTAMQGYFLNGQQYSIPWDGSRWVYAKNGYLYGYRIKIYGNENVSAETSVLATNVPNANRNNYFPSGWGSNQYYEYPVTYYASNTYYVTNGTASICTMPDNSTASSLPVTTSILNGQYYSISNPNNLIVTTGVSNLGTASSNKYIYIASSSNSGSTWNEYSPINITTASYDLLGNPYVMATPMFLFNNRYFVLFGINHIYNGYNRILAYSASSLNGPWSGSIVAASGNYNFHGAAISKNSVVISSEHSQSGNAVYPALYSNDGYNWINTGSAGTLAYQEHIICCVYSQSASLFYALRCSQVGSNFSLLTSNSGSVWSGVNIDSIWADSWTSTYNQNNGPVVWVR
jgi:hypothetical protein